MRASDALQPVAKLFFEPESGSPLASRSTRIAYSRYSVSNFTRVPTRWVLLHPGTCVAPWERRFAEWMLGRLATLAHGLRVRIEALLHSCKVHVHAPSCAALNCPILGGSVVSVVLMFSRKLPRRIDVVSAAGRHRTCTSIPVMKNCDAFHSLDFSDVFCSSLRLSILLFASLMWTAARPRVAPSAVKEA